MRRCGWKFGHASVRMECPLRAKSGHRSAGYRRSSCNRGRLCHVPHHFDFGPRSGGISKSITAAGSSSARFWNTAANEQLCTHGLTIFGAGHHCALCCADQATNEPVTAVRQCWYAGSRCDRAGSWHSRLRCHLCSSADAVAPGPPEPVTTAKWRDSPLYAVCLVVGPQTRKD